MVTHNMLRTYEGTTIGTKKYDSRICHKNMINTFWVFIRNLIFNVEAKNLTKGILCIPSLLCFFSLLKKSKGNQYLNIFYFANFFK